MSDNRPDWHTYFMKMAYLVSERSTCLRRKVGAVIIKNNQIISTGYNGAPKGVPHCSQTGCLRAKTNVPSGERHELCRGVHAEQNAIIQAAVNGVSISNAELYCTNQPCSICAKMLINAEIRNIFVSEVYEDKLARTLLEQASVNVFHFDMKTKTLTKIV
ncbi:MAG: cytidine/deoxycytidylate deaminase family protein [Candidatus Cloacimonetes bacterium]|nr:cytidine/deoxycytidylate deaminase family protein [Candidatus Cloacimonadota bacterium]